MQARFAILRTLLAATEKDASSGAPLLAIQEARDAASGVLRDLSLTLNRSKIGAVGVPAVKDLLLQLNVCKATADVAGGAGMFKALTEVDAGWLERRDVVLAKKQPRPVFVQVGCIAGYAAIL